MRLDSRRTPSRRAIAYTTNAELAKATAAAAWLKWYTTVTFLIIAGANALVFETAYGRRAAALPVGEDTPVPLKIIAGVSLIAWMGVLWAGRMLPFLGAGVGAGL